MSAPRIRFSTAREVFEAFPTARQDLEAAPTNESPFAFMRSLLGSRTPEDAIAFCAYVLPRREAVWWACHCIRALSTHGSQAEDVALLAAEAWVREPEEERRYEALRIGMAGSRAAPATWAALAAAWSGGSMLAPEEGASVPAPPHLTARAARAAVLTALAQVGAKDRAARLARCLEDGLRLADSHAGTK